MTFTAALAPCLLAGHPAIQPLKRRCGEPVQGRGNKYSQWRYGTLVHDISAASMKTYDHVLQCLAQIPTTEKCSALGIVRIIDVTAIYSDNKGSIFADILVLDMRRFYTIPCFFLPFSLETAARHFFRLRSTSAGPPIDCTVT